MQQPRYQVPREQHEVRVPSLGQLDENRLGLTRSDPVLRVKRSGTESDQIRALGNKTD